MIPNIKDDFQRHSRNVCIMRIIENKKVFFKQLNTTRYICIAKWKVSSLIVVLEFLSPRQLDIPRGDGPRLLGGIEDPVVSESWDVDQRGQASSSERSLHHWRSRRGNERVSLQLRLLLLPPSRQVFFSAQLDKLFLEAVQVLVADFLLEGSLFSLE